MESPPLSSTVNFVKQYPITLCGFSLLFMPSVYRLLLYFTPLLISTAIFIVAMLSWGPSVSSERGKRRGKKPNDWTLNGSFKLYDDEGEEDDDDEEEEGEVADAAEVSQKGESSEDITQKIAISISGKASDEKPDQQKEVDPKLQEPDPDYDSESKHVRMAPNGAISGAQAEPDPDLQGEGVGASPSNTFFAEPDPDLHAEENLDQPAHDQGFSAEKHLHAAPDLHHHLPAAHDHHEETASIDSDHHAAGDHLSYHDAEQDHPHYHDAEINHIDHDEDAEANDPEYHDAEPDPDLERDQCAKLQAAHVENDDHLHAAISEVQQQLGMVQRAPCSDESRLHQPAECLQTLQTAA